MTKAHSEPGDNGGRCEGCNRPETEFQTQVTWPVLLGGGLGWGTMWLCAACVAERGERREQRAMKHTIEMTTEEIVQACQEWLRNRYECYKDELVQLKASPYPDGSDSASPHVIEEFAHDAEFRHPAVFTATATVVR